MEKIIKNIYDDLIQNNKRATKWKIFIAVLSSLLIYSMVVYALLPHKLSVSIGSTMPKTVYATKKVEDTVSTNDVRERIADQIPFQYSVSDKLTNQQLTGFRDYYNSILNARNYAYENSVRDSEGNVLISTVMVEDINNRFNTSLTIEEISNIVNISQEVLLDGFKNAEDLLKHELNDGIYENDVTNVRLSVLEKLTQGYEALKPFVEKGLKAHVVTNMLYDEQATMVERQKARDNVEPIYYTKGQVVAYKGEVLNEAQYDVLESLGFVGEGLYYDVNILFGVAILLTMLFAYYYVYIYNFNYNVFGRIKYFTLCVSIMVVTVAFCVFALNFREYLMPVSLAGLLTVTLIDRKVALLNNIVVCGLIGVIQRNSWDFYSIFVFIISTMVGIYMFDRKKTRFGIILAGFVTACMGFAINVAYMFIAETIGDVVTIMTFKPAYKFVVSVIVLNCLPSKLLKSQTFASSVKESNSKSSRVKILLESQ